VKEAQDEILSLIDLVIGRLQTFKPILDAQDVIPNLKAILKIRDPLYTVHTFLSVHCSRYPEQAIELAKRTNQLEKTATKLDGASSIDLNDEKKYRQFLLERKQSLAKYLPSEQDANDLIHDVENFVLYLKMLKLLLADDVQTRETSSSSIIACNPDDDLKQIQQNILDVLEKETLPLKELAEKAGYVNSGWLRRNVTILKSKGYIEETQSGLKRTNLSHDK
jgi:hypothetical protein